MSWVMKGLLAKRDVYSWALFQLWKLSSKPRQESCNVENVVKLTAMTGAGMRAMADVDTACSWSLVRLPISAAVRPPVIINLPLLFWGQVSWTWIKHATWNGSTCAAVHKERSALQALIMFWRRNARRQACVSGGHHDQLQCENAPIWWPIASTSTSAQVLTGPSTSSCWMSAM